MALHRVDSSPIFNHYVFLSQHQSRSFAQSLSSKQILNGFIYGPEQGTNRTSKKAARRRERETGRRRGPPPPWLDLKPQGCKCKPRKAFGWGGAPLEEADGNNSRRVVCRRRHCGSSAAQSAGSGRPAVSGKDPHGLVHNATGQWSATRLRMGDCLEGWLCKTYCIQFG